MTDFQLKGGKELDAFLQSLPAKLEANIMRSALSSGARVIRDEAKANVPVHLGELQKSVRVSSRIKNGVVTASVRAGNKAAWYWRFVEYGTKAHLIGTKDGGALSIGGTFAKSVQHPGATAKPFMRPALDTRSGEAIAAVAATIRKRLTKEGINSPAPAEADE